MFHNNCNRIILEIANKVSINETKPRTAAFNETKPRIAAFQKNRNNIPQNQYPIIFKRL